MILLSKVAGMVFMALLFITVSVSIAGGSEPDCIPGSEQEDHCVLDAGSVNILPHGVSSAAVFDGSFRVYNPTESTQTVHVRVGCIANGSNFWFENNHELEIDAETQVVIPSDDQVVVAFHVPLKEFGDNSCQTWQGGNPYAYIASADIANLGDPMIIYGNTKFTLKSDYDQAYGSTTTTTSTTTPGQGGGDARFLDVPLDHTFNDDVEWLAAEGVTRGCDPPLNLHYCPDDPVTRGQMAAFLVRALGLPARGYDEYATFADVGSTHTFFDEVGILGAEGITRGCNPPDNSRFCPDDPVTRGQMAAFLVRALGLPPSSTDSFVDDDGSVFEKDIQALAASGITRGCNPPANSRFCPDEPVSRAQMAAFLHRALGQ